MVLMLCESIPYMIMNEDRCAEMMSCACQRTLLFPPFDDNVFFFVKDVLHVCEFLSRLVL